MNWEEDDIINELYEKEKNQSKINKIDNIFKVSKGTLKIELENGAMASGFFLKFKRNSKPFYCIMTNSHVITSELIKDKKELLYVFKNHQQLM